MELGLGLGIRSHKCRLFGLLDGLEACALTLCDENKRASREVFAAATAAPVQLMCNLPGILCKSLL